MSRPPSNPAVGARWRDGKTVYRFAPGRGWVAEKFYQPPAPAQAPVRAETSPEPVRPVEPEIEATPAALPPPAPAPVNRCACGAAIMATSKRCKPCFQAARRGSGKPKEKPTCSDCGGPRSLGSGQRCRACYEIVAAATRPPPPPAPPPNFKPDPAEVERVRRAVERMRAPPPVVDDLPPARPLAITEPHPIAITEPHPILERHAHAKDFNEPLVRPRERQPAGKPEFSPEFLAKLERVRNGAAIVEVRPLRTALADMPGRGCSLADVI